jgi:uncharacterized protein (DUF433 family)
MQAKGGTMSFTDLDVYSDGDLREAPSYQMKEAAHYLSIPYSTVRAWTVGMTYGTRYKKRRFQPVIEPASKDPIMLSFMNLVELHILDALRRKRKIRLPKVRQALDYLQKQFPCKHPLLDPRLASFGLDLFIQHYGDLINLNRSGQLAMIEILGAYLKRIDRDVQGYPLRLYPFLGDEVSDDPKLIMIDPHISFGGPVIAGTGILTSAISERFRAGELISELAVDYGLESAQIEGAIRFEFTRKAA